MGRAIVGLLTVVATLAVAPGADAQLTVHVEHERFWVYTDGAHIPPSLQPCDLAGTAGTQEISFADRTASSTIRLRLDRDATLRARRRSHDSERRAGVTALIGGVLGGLALGVPLLNGYGYGTGPTLGAMGLALGGAVMLVGAGLLGMSDTVDVEIDELDASRIITADAPVARVFVDFGIGSAGMLAMIFAGIAAQNAGGAAFAVAASVMTLASPAIITAIGAATSGRGDFLAAVIGAVIGVGLVWLVSTPNIANDAGDGWLLAAFGASFAASFLGAVIGYEAMNTTARRATEAGAHTTPLTAVPVVAPIDGGAVVGAAAIW